MPSDQFAVSVIDGVVHVEGEIDSFVARAFNEVLDDVPGPLTVDCAAVTFLDSAGVAVLVRQYQQRCEEGDGFRLVNLGRPVRRVLEITGLLDLLAPCPPGEVTVAPQSFTAERSELDLAG